MFQYFGLKVEDLKKGQIYTADKITWELEQNNSGVTNEAASFYRQKCLNVYLTEEPVPYLVRDSREMAWIEHRTSYAKLNASE